MSNVVPLDDLPPELLLELPGATPPPSNVVPLEDIPENLRPGSSFVRDAQREADRAGMEHKPAPRAGTGAQDIGKAATQGFASGTGRWVGNRLADVATLLSGPNAYPGGQQWAAGKPVEAFAGSVGDYWKGVEQANKPSDEYEARSPLDPVKIIGGTAGVLGGLPPVLAAGAAGAVAGGPGVATLAASYVGGQLEAEGAYEQWVAEGMDPNEARARANVYHVASAVLNAPSISRIVKGMPNVAERLVTALWEAGTEISEGPTQALISGRMPNPRTDPEGAIAFLTSATVDEAKGVGIPAFLSSLLMGGGGAPAAPQEQPFVAQPGIPTGGAMAQGAPLTPASAFPMTDVLTNNPAVGLATLFPATTEQKANTLAATVDRPAPLSAPLGAATSVPAQPIAAPGASQAAAAPAAPAPTGNLERDRFLTRVLEAGDPVPLEDLPEGLEVPEVPAPQAEAEADDVVLPLKDEKMRPFERALTPRARRDLVAMRKDAEAHEPAYRSLVQAIQDAISPGTHTESAVLGGNYGIPPLKGWDRIVQKIVAEEKGDHTALKDMLRSTVFVRNAQEGEAALAAVLERIGRAPGSKIRRSLLDLKPDKFGYADVKVNVPGPNGRVYEVQINSPALFDLKEKQGHVFYEQAHDIQALAQTEQRPLTWKEKRAIVQLRKQSRAVYAPGLAAWAAASKSSPSRATTQAGVDTRQAPSGPTSRDSNSSGSSQMVRPLYDQARQSEPGASDFVSLSTAPSVARKPLARGEKAAASRPGESEGEGLTVKQLRKILGNVLDRLPRDVRSKIYLVGNSGYLPPEILRSMGPNVEGVINMRTGEIYLVGRNIRNPARARSALAHELVGHLGLKRMLGAKQFTALVHAVRKARFKDETIKRTWAEAKERYPREDQDTLAIETLAITAESEPTHSLVRRLWAALRYYVRVKLDLAIELTQDDLIYMLNRARDQLLVEKERKARRPPDRIDTAGYVPPGSPSGTRGELFIPRYESRAPQLDQQGRPIPEGQSDIFAQPEPVAPAADRELEKQTEVAGFQLTPPPRAPMAQKDLFGSRVRRANEADTLTDATWRDGEVRQVVIGSSGNRRIDVLKNPSRADLARFDQTNEWSGSYRFSLDYDSGSVVVWDAGQATHWEIEDRLGIYSYGSGISNNSWDNAAAIRADLTDTKPGQDYDTVENIHSAIRQTIGRAVKLGSITQDKADAILAKSDLGLLASRPPPTESAAFKEWFGESKIVDENGAPEIAVHYTNNDFDVFDNGRQEQARFNQQGYTTEYGRDFVFPRDGFFFFIGSAPKPAGKFSRAIHAYLSIKNPLDLTKPIPPDDVSKIISFLNSSINKPLTGGQGGSRVRGNKIGGLRNARKNGLTPQQLWEFIGDNTFTSRGRLWNKLLRELGKDGLIFNGNSSGTFEFEDRRGRGDGKTYKIAVALEPNQIKSATGNSGAFDSTNPSILAARAPVAPTQGNLVPPAPPAPTPTKIKAGGGEYTTAPMLGIPAQTQRLVLAVMAAEDANIATERRGTVTWKMTGDNARELLESKFGRTFNSLVNRIQASTANAETLEAYAQVVNAGGKALQKAVDDYTRTQSAEDLLRLNAAREQLGIVLAPFMGYRTEAGRALNILKKIQSDFTDAQAIFEALGDGNEAAMRDFAKRVKSAGSVADALALTMDSYRPKAIDQFREYWINGLLSGPWTHVVNIASNTAYMGLEIGTELAASLVSPNISTRASLARIRGMMAGAVIGASSAIKAFKTEEPQLDSRTQIENAKSRAISGKLGRAVRIPGRLLMAEDEFAKAVNYTGELYRMAMDEAIAANPRDPGAEFGRILAGYANNRAVKAKAQAHARRLTFQTKLGAFGQGVMNLREQAGPFGWMPAPFIRTPTNILKRALEYLPPTAALAPSVREQLREGGYSRDMALARMTIGTSLIWGVVSAVLAGAMTGAGPDDPKERALWMRLGKKPYSVNPAALMRGGESREGDTWYRYNRFEPVGMVLGISSDLAEIGQTVQKGDYDKVATMMLASIMLNLADKTYLRGIVDASQALLEPKRYMETWLAGMAGTIVPNIVAQTARATDPLVREARGIVDSFKARIPGVRQQLPAKLDVAGEPIKRSLFEPAAGTEQRTDPLAQTMLELGVFQGAPGRKIKMRGREIELNSEQYADLKQRVQRVRWGRLTPMVQSRGFRSLMEKDPARAAAALRNQYTQIGEAEKLRWLRDNRAILEQLRASPRSQPKPSNYAEAAQ